MENKIKPHGVEVTDFLGKKIPKLDSNSSLDSALKKDDNYYLQLLKERRYIEKKVVRHIYDNLSEFFYSSDESDEE